MNRSEPPDSRPLKSPFFLVGALRSGTTLLRLMLGHHSRICRCEEMEFVTIPMQLGLADGPIEEYYDYLQMDRGFRLSGYSLDKSLAFPELARSFLEQLREREKKELVGAVVHHHFDRLPKLWPSAKYIHLRRDPRDVAKSCVEMSWAGTAWGGAKIWIDAFDAWDRLSKLVPPEQLLSVRFEDLVEEPEQILAEICSFIGVEYEPAMLDIERDTTYRRPNKNEAQNWREAYLESEIAAVESRIGSDRMINAGYTPHSEALAPHGRPGTVFMRATNAIRRGNRRRRRYGTWLWLQAILCTRLPSQNLLRNTKLKIDDVDDRLSQ